VLLYLACIAVCGIFFSLGFLVGFNERGSHSGPATEIVNAPSVVPPTINAPPDGGSQIPTPDASSARTSATAEPETEVITGPGQAAPPVADEKPAKSSKKHHQAEVETPAPAARAAVHADPGEGLVLQVAALRTRADADTMIKLLKGRGYPVFMSSPQKSGEESLYRVEVGPFRTRAEADKAKGKLVADGFKPFIKH
jgi:cell division septation protein DedD